MAGEGRPGGLPRGRHVDGEGGRHPRYGHVPHSHSRPEGDESAHFLQGPGGRAGMSLELVAFVAPCMRRSEKRRSAPSWSAPLVCVSGVLGHDARQEGRPEQARPCPTGASSGSDSEAHRHHCRLKMQVTVTDAHTRAVN